MAGRRQAAEIMTTVSDLKTYIAGYLHRTDLTDYLAVFVESARQRVNTDLRGKENIGIFTATLSTGTTPDYPYAVIPYSRGGLPAAILQFHAVMDDDNQRMLNEIPFVQLEAYSGVSQPAVYAVTTAYDADNGVITTLWVPGGDGVQISGTYWADVGPFGTTNGETINPNIFPFLRTAAMMEGALFCNNMDLYAQLSARYGQEIQAANTAFVMSQMVRPQVTTPWGIDAAPALL
jgi:hypothetical protein